MKLRTLHELGHDEREVTLIDTDEHTAELNIHLENTDIALVPRPSNDPNDPLRFPQWKKWAAFANVCVLTFMTTAWIGGLSPAFYLLTQQLNISPGKAGGLLIWPILSAGLCNFFWTPTAEYLGRRPVFVLASLVVFACEIWASVAPDYQNLLASRTIGAFFGSCTEAMGALTVNDIFYLHERGSKMGIYILALYLGNSIGPLLTGYITQGLGWRWVSWIWAIISGLNLIGFVFLFPETRWHRTIDAAADRRITPASNPDQNLESKFSTENTVEHVDTNDSTIPAGVRKTYFQELSLWSGTTKVSYVNHLIRPFPLLAYPAIALGALSYSMALAWLLGTGILSSFVFAYPPYNFSTGTNGLINIPGIIGTFVGAFVGGKCTDMYARRRARQNGGKFLPEWRLVLLLVPFVLGPAGLLMFGIGAQKKLHWAVLFVGFGCISIVPAASTIAMTYVMDSYFEVAAEGLLVVNGVKNVVAFGFSYGFTSWTDEVGYSKVFGTMAGLWMFVLLLYLPLYIWGPQIRRHTTLAWKIVLFE